jgi:hypothetical protein
MAMMAELETRFGEKASYCHYPQEAKAVVSSIVKRHPKPTSWWMREEPQWVNLLGSMKKTNTMRINKVSIASYETQMESHERATLTIATLKTSDVGE